MGTIKYVTIVLSCLLLFCGCAGNQASKKENNMPIDSVALRDSVFKTELIQNEGNKAIGNIDFFISQEEFDKQVDLFKSPLEAKSIYQTGYYLGDYNFWSINGAFFNDSLMNVHVRGGYIGYDLYKTQMPEQYKSLLSILKEKYGLPQYEKELPDALTVLDYGSIVLAEWNLGFKSLLVFVNCMDFDYRLDFAFYVPALTKRAKDKKMDESDKRNKEASKLL